MLFQEWVWFKYYHWKLEDPSEHSLGLGSASHNQKRTEAMTWTDSQIGKPVVGLCSFAYSHLPCEWKLSLRHGVSSGSSTTVTVDRTIWEDHSLSSWTRSVFGHLKSLFTLWDLENNKLSVILMSQCLRFSAKHVPGISKPHPTDVKTLISRCRSVWCSLGLHSTLDSTGMELLTSSRTEHWSVYENIDLCWVNPEANDFHGP